MTAEEQARRLLDRIGVDDVQNYSNGELGELANILNENTRLYADNLALIKRLEEKEQQLAKALELLERNGIVRDDLFKQSSQTTSQQARAESPRQEP